MSKKFSSREGTLDHIKRVNELLIDVAKEFLDRAVKHDSTKIIEPELSGFDMLDPDFRKLKYGSPEYYDVINKPEVQEAIKHHHSHNSHHTEYYEKGAMGMDLFDLLEMVCDWKAASERNLGSDFEEHMKYNFERFNIPPDLQVILANTIRRLFLGYRL